MRERNREILVLRLQGWTLDRIGAQYGISRQRVWSIIRTTMESRKKEMYWEVPPPRSERETV